MSFLKQYSGLFLIILLSFFTIRPLFAPGFFPVHDDTQVARVFEMKTALADGMFPVRWVPDLGFNYGYPIFNFYGPFAYYVGGFFNLIGFDSLIATKLMIMLGTLIAGVSMYFLAKEFWGKAGGLVSAVLYMYAPYHALNIYVRGAIGELWAYGLLPFAFLGIYKLFTFSREVPKANKKSAIVTYRTSFWMWVSFSALVYAAIVVSHNLTAMMVTPFLFVFAFLLYIISRVQVHTTRSYFILLGLLIGIFLSAFYWLPVIFEMKYTNVLSVVGGGSDYKDHFVCLRQLWDSPWGFGGSVPGCIDGLSFRIGKLHIILGLLSLIPLVFLRSQKKIMLSISLSAFTAILSIFLTLDSSKFIWDAIPQMAFFQFPWRFLVLASFALSFSGGAIFLLIKMNLMWQYICAAGIIFVVIFLNAKLFVADRIIDKSVSDYTNKSFISWDTSKISDEYMPPYFQRPKTKNEVPTAKIMKTKGVVISSYSEKTQHIHAIVDSKQKIDLPVYIAYFPGWHVYIDNNQESFKYYKKGLLVPIPAGKHTLDVEFSQTLIEEIGNALSLTGVFILLAGIIASRKEVKHG